MKRIKHFSAILAMVMIFSLSGCMMDVVVESTEGSSSAETSSQESGDGAQSQVPTESNQEVSSSVGEQSSPSSESTSVSKDPNTLQNSRLTVKFDPESGLSTVRDGETGKTWQQCYAIPPEGEVAFACDFTDSSRWNIGGSGLSGSNIVTSIRPGKQEIKMNFPAPGIMPATYILRIKYRFQNAKDVTLRGIFHFEQDSYTPRGNKTFDIAVAKEKTTTDGWLTAEIPIRLEEFPAYTNCFLLFFEVIGGSGASGSVIIGDTNFYGGDSAESYPIITDVKRVKDTISYFANNVEREKAKLPPVKVSLSLSADRSDEIVVSMDGAEEEYWYQEVNLPGSFVSADESLRWVLPKDAGLYLPAYDLNNKTNRSYSGGEVYVHMGLNMAMFGAVIPSSGDGYYVLIDDPALTAFKYMPCGTEGGKTAYMPQLIQIGTNSYWEKDRTVRFRFKSEGGYLGLAQDYRKIAEEKGFAVTLKEKAKENPNILKSAGAHRIDLAIDIKDTEKFFAKLKEAGVTDVMVKLGGMRNSDLSYIEKTDLYEKGIYKMLQQKYPEYYLYEYECYRDLFMQDGEFKADMNYVELATPYRLRWESGFVRGWVDASGLQSFVVCPEFGPIYLDWTFNTKYPVKNYPVYARMYDVLATTSFKEGVCFDEEHPGTRLTAYQKRIEFMKLSAETYGMDNHTEGTAEYLIPYVNSGEGPLGIMGSSTNAAGLNVMDVSPADRIPFWELVYHDCYGLYYHWEHGLTTNPEMVNENLYCVLYGERGMFLPVAWENPFGKGSSIDRFIEQMKRISVVTKRVALEKMTNHQFLTADGLVQKTTFADGTEVIVNFSNKIYKYQNGKVTTVSSGKDDGVTSVSKGKANGRLIFPNKELVILP